MVGSEDDNRIIVGAVPFQLAGVTNVVTGFWEGRVEIGRAGGKFSQMLIDGLQTFLRDLRFLGGMAGKNMLRTGTQKG